MKIYLGSDHGGFELKEKVKSLFLDLETKIQVIDCGALSFDSKDDYPDFAINVAEKMIVDPDFKSVDLSNQNPAVLGLLFCRSGSGMVITANKIKGIRAVELYNEKIAVAAKSHNHVNLLSFGADTLSFKEVILIIKKYLATDFDRGERHQRRIDKISQYELEHF